MAAPNGQNAVKRFVRERWISLVILIVAIIFIAQNHRSVSIDLFWAHLTAPLWMVLSVMFLAGWIAAAVRTRRRARVRDLASKNAR